MKRGDVVVVAMQGDFGKPRPALVIQSDLFNETHASITVAPVTKTIVDAPLFRLTVEPSSSNGLRSVSQIMVTRSDYSHCEDEGPTPCTDPPIVSSAAP